MAKNKAGKAYLAQLEAWADDGTPVASVHLAKNAIGVQLRKLPECITRLRGLAHLSIAGQPITALPEAFTELTELETLDVSFTTLKELPDEILGLPNLARLDAMEFRGTLHNIGKAKGLRSLRTTGTPPGSIAALAELHTVSLGYPDTLPDLGKLPNLKALHISTWRPGDFPLSILGLDQLEIFSFTGSHVAGIPRELVELPLRALHLRATAAAALLDASAMTALKVLILSGQAETGQPSPQQDVVDAFLQAPNLEDVTLDRWGPYRNEGDARYRPAVLRLPPGIGALEKLRRVNLASPVEDLPESFYELPRLEWLELSKPVPEAMRERLFRSFPEAYIDGVGTDLGPMPDDVVDLALAREDTQARIRAKRKPKEADWKSLADNAEDAIERFAKGHLHHLDSQAKHRRHLVEDCACDLADAALALETKREAALERIADLMRHRSPMNLKGLALRRARLLIALDREEESYAWAQAAGGPHDITWSLGFAKWLAGSHLAPPWWHEPHPKRAGSRLEAILAPRPE